MIKTFCDGCGREVHATPEMPNPWLVAVIVNGAKHDGHVCPNEGCAAKYLEKARTHLLRNTFQSQVLGAPPFTPLR